MKRIFTFFILANMAIAMFAQTPPVLKGTLDSDKAALLEVYAALNGSNWTKAVEGVDVPFNWSADTDILDFVGVTVEAVEGVDRVTEVDLSAINNLEGTIPAAFGKLDGLQFIDLSSNLYLTDSIPDAFYDMISLETLRLSNTSISGTLSNKIGQMAQLKTIFMEKNSFLTGGLPDGIGKCTMLDYIRVADNVRMTGNISEEISKCTALTVLQCERSNFSGKIPAGLAKMANLKYLNMNYNNFSSAPNFAAEGARFPSTMLEIHQNLIPFGDLLPMKDFTRNSAKDGWYYRFIDQKPGTPLTKDTLKVKLAAPLVIDIDELQPNNGGVSFRWFFNDAVIGTDKVLNLTMSEETVGNYYCEITTDQDILNSGICPLCGWQDAEATINPRPSYMATNTTAKLAVIVNTSSLKGTLDSDKAALLEVYATLNGPNWTKTVEGEDLPFNWSEETDILDFVGVTVGQIEGADRVIEVDLSSVNYLEGEIPADLGKLDGLQFIDLSSNLYLSGPIPDAFYDLASLVTLRMANTSISGTISNKIGQLTQLKTIFMEKNSFLTGGIPDGIGKCLLLDYIRIADNIRMTGNISEEISKCTALTVLQCERSNFSGKIPAGLAKMANLKYLNMNYNNFSSAPNFAAEGARFPSTMLEIHQNLIPFGDLLPMKDFTRNSAKDGWYYRFIDQKPGTPLTKDTLKVKLAAPLVIDIDELQPNHGGVSFRWFFNDAVIGTDKVLNLTMNEGTAGNYYCEITTDQDILNSGICPLCGWQDAENTINPRPSSMATNTTAILVVIADNTTGINASNSNKGLSVVKNADHGSFTLLVTDKSIIGKTYQVIDIGGRIIKTGKVESNIQHLNINTPNGIYILKYNAAGKNAAKKLIVN